MIIQVEGKLKTSTKCFHSVNGNIPACHAEVASSNLAGSSKLCVYGVNGNTSAFQAEVAGSNPARRSKCGSALCNVIFWCIRYCIKWIRVKTWYNIYWNANRYILFWGCRFDSYRFPSNMHGWLNGWGSGLQIRIMWVRIPSRAPNLAYN